jgi:hypothetical protein
VRPKDQPRAKTINKALVAFDSVVKPLPGVKNEAARKVLVEQIIESLRRIEYAHLIRDSRKIDPNRANSSSAIFDPIRAAVLRMRNGEFDEAFWLIFLSVHFGKHSKDGWRLARDIYGALGGTPWTWARVSANPQAFRAWLAKNEAKLRNDGVSRRFSNHRKYESLSASSPAGTAAAIESYVNWVSPPRTHQQLIQSAHRTVGQNPMEVFDYLYQSMNAVRRFGRLGKFDYLTMLGKLGLAPIEPGSAYFSGATGPLRGARLLFGGNPSTKLNCNQLDDLLNELNGYLNVGMQVLEDSLCNWQKSPKKFKSFRG